MDPFTLSLLISAGVGGISAWYQRRQADKAAGREIDMSKEALALEQYMFEQSRQDQREVRDEDKRRWEIQQGDRDRTYDDNAGYRNIGLGALDRLAFGVGIPGKPSDAVASARRSRPSAVPPWTSGEPMQPWSDGPAPVFTGGGGTVTGGSLATLGTPQAANVSQGGMTTMQTPTGQTVLVPASKVQEALANGGRVIGGRG